MRHTPKTARNNAQSVYAKMLRKLNASVNNEGNVYYPAKENFNNNGPTRGNLLRRQTKSQSRYNHLLRQANKAQRQFSTVKHPRENEASAFRKLLANVRARLRGTGRNLTA
jgi:hypothetical protein